MVTRPGWERETVCLEVYVSGEWRVRFVWLRRRNSAPAVVKP